MECQWRLSFGWTAAYGPYGTRDPKHRPAHIESLSFHSFEAALHFPSRGTWWEIYTPDGQVAMSSHSGFNEEAVPTPSLCARQILFPEEFRDVGEAERERDQVSRDDGETWESVLLGVKDAAQKPSFPSLPKPTPVEILSVSPSEPGRITLSHSRGRMTVKASSLELRRGKAAYSLWVLGTPRGIYTRVDEGTALILQSLGVREAGEKGAGGNGFVKAWKPALFRIQQTGKEPLEVRGFSRGLLGIDRRRVERTNTWKDYEGKERTYTYTSLLYHLTHLPTGLLIASWKHKNAAQEFADLLRERMPELTDTGVEEVTPETGKRVKEILAEYSA